MSEFYETFFFYVSFIMKSLILQSPHYIWSSYGKLEIQFKSIARFFSIINTDITQSLESNSTLKREKSLT